MNRFFQGAAQAGASMVGPPRDPQIFVLVLVLCLVVGFVVTSTINPGPRPEPCAVETK